MPPEDALFPDDTSDFSPPGPANGSGEGVVEGEPAAGGAPITHDDVLGLVKQFVEPSNAQMARITQNQQALAQTLENIQETFTRLGLHGGQAGQSGTEDEMDPTDFITNPQPHIEQVASKVAEGVLREQIAPLLSQIVTQTHAQTVAEQRANIDSQFGEGAWDEHFAPELNPMFDRVRKDNPSQLGNADAISRAVDAVKGAKFSTLAERATQTAAQRQQAEEERQQSMVELVQSNLTGGISRAGGKSTLTEEMKDFMEKEFRATGAKPDEKSFLAAVNSGSTLNDWKAAQASLQKK